MRFWTTSSHRWTSERSPISTQPNRAVTLNRGRGGGSTRPTTRHRTSCKALKCGRGKRSPGSNSPSLGKTKGPIANTKPINVAPRTIDQKLINTFCITPLTSSMLRQHPTTPSIPNQMLPNTNWDNDFIRDNSSTSNGCDQPSGRTSVQSLASNHLWRT